jgi:hypothetical protein
MYLPNWTTDLYSALNYQENMSPHARPLAVLHFWPCLRNTHTVCSQHFSQARVLIKFSLTIRGIKHYAYIITPPNYYCLAYISTDMGCGGCMIGRNTFAWHMHTHKTHPRLCVNSETIKRNKTEICASHCSRTNWLNF